MRGGGLEGERERGRERERERGRDGEGDREGKRGKESEGMKRRRVIFCVGNKCRGVVGHLRFRV